MQFAVRDRRGRRQRVVPDGVAVVRVGSEVEVLALEVDLNTVPVRRMARRYQAYWQDFTSGGARVRFGRCSYRVLTVSNDPARLAALRRAARQAPTRGRRASRLFWFAPLEAFDPAAPSSPLAPTFTHAGYLAPGATGAPEPLWPALNPSTYASPTPGLPPSFRTRPLPPDAPSP